MKKLLLLIGIYTLFAMPSFGQTEQSVLLEEGFETDGHPSRYTASSSGGFNNGDSSYFRRTDGSDITMSGNNPYSGFSDTWFWATNDSDHIAGDRMVEQTIVFNPINIAEVTGLSISGLFGASNDFLPGTAQSHEGYSPEAYLRLTYQIDSGEETDVLCFRHEDHPSSGNDPFGLDADCNGTADNLDGIGRLRRALATYSADIPGTGSSLTVRIRVRATGTDEQMAFDDIKVTGTASASDPTPSNHPTAFMATTAGQTQIDLSWADATGTNLPSGYVLYAGRSSSFSAPTDGTPPAIDNDLSDGSAVVTINHGAGSSHMFTGLNPSTTYYFQIWAYIETGSGIGYLLSPAGPTLSVATEAVGPNGLVVLLNEGFESDGYTANPRRYTVSSDGGFRAGNNAHFQRTDGSDIANVSGVYTGFSGTHFWAAEQTGDATGDGNEEQTITFNPINIAGFTNLSISGLFGAGNETLPQTDFTYDAGDFIKLTAQIDLGVETEVLCFRYEDHGDRGNEPLGLDVDCNGTADVNGANRLGLSLAEYSADILETGNMLTLRIKVLVNGNNEEIAFDDIKVTGTLPRPEPSEQPTGFWQRAGQTQIDLSWTDAVGTNVPTGYVIYAGTNSSLSAPTDGVPPTIDTDLSDGSAVVTVKHGVGGSYTFTGLTVSTAYHFQIWAYSNTGSDIDYLIAPAGPAFSGTTASVIFQEGFETDGHTANPRRYTASSDGGFRANNGAYFTRTNGSDIQVFGTGTGGAYSGVSGTTFWAAEDTDHPSGGEMAEQTIVFAPIDIAGYRNLSVSGLFGAGNETLPRTSGFTYDENDFIKLTAQIGEGAEMEVLCFRYENYGDNNDEPLGLDLDCNGSADVNGANRLGLALTKYSADIEGRGNMLTLTIRVFVNGNNEEIAFDDITVAGIPTSAPEPSQQPTVFMAVASGSDQIDLSWTDAIGMELPTGYVIHASETNSFFDPIDGTPPVIDSDLSNGNAVVTVNNSVGGYTFTGLTASTTYYFKIWAYSNAGNNIDYLTSMAPTASGTTLDVIFQEGFETNGHGTRYTASSIGGFQSGPSSYFHRTNGSNIDIHSADAYSGFSGMYFWAAENTGVDTDADMGEETIAFNKVSIAGFTGLSVSGLFAAGNETPPGTSYTYDAHDYIRVSYQVDSRTETDVLCFRTEFHDDNFNEPLGLDADCDGIADNSNGTDRLGTVLTGYSANIPETGDFLTIRIKVAVTGGGEEIAFDDITVAGAPTSELEPSQQPTAFMAVASSDQIDLSWTDATGADLPTGYVIYASETNLFSDPMDGTPPVIDSDLSNGNAVVTVNNGVGGYTFTGLTASTTYYFKIWAYSNAGSGIDYLTGPAGSTASGTTLDVIFQEGFETNGHGTRYTASSSGGFYNARHNYFFRLSVDDAVDDPMNRGIAVSGQLNNAAGYTGFSGGHFWAAENTGHSDGDDMAEQTIVFAPIDIAGFTDLSISGRFALGAPRFRSDNYVRVTAQIDGGNERSILCFEYQDDGPPEENQPLARDMDCDGTASTTDMILARHQLTQYTANIPETGNMLTLWIKVHADASGKEIAFDDITVTGVPGSEPQPDAQPTAFMAVVSGSDQIDLSWTDATGTHLPTGYVIHASETNSFSDPEDGTPPVIDSDLSDGTAVVTVNHGTGGSYTFTGLTASTTYYFKIWAYSNAGSSIDYLTDPEGPTILATPVHPQPDAQPTAFMAVALSDQIDLSWTDATGTHLPTGYVIYASETNSFSDPIDGTPPVIDSDLSNGNAVVTVNNGVGGYTFTGLTASTTYYFQIWAYSNIGSHIDYLTDPAGSTVSGTTLDVIFQEGFETNGHGTRYTTSSSGGFRGTDNDYFIRTTGSQPRISITGPPANAEYTGFMGMHFWAAEDTDHPSGDDEMEQTIVFNPIGIAGFTGLNISGLFGAGNEGPPGINNEIGGNAYDVEDYIQVSYHIDSGVETNVLCFAYENHGNNRNQPIGLDANCDGTADNTNGTGRLGLALAKYSVDIPGTGDFLTVRVKVKVPHGNEELAFDDITVAGILSSEPEPSNQPTVFMAVASGSDQIDLSWTDATGTHLPTGYVIHASETNSFFDPIDGTPPVIDSDLSNGNAVVTVNNGVGGYTFTGLTASTTYYFQIWAYSNAGIGIDYLTDSAGPTASVTTPGVSQTIILEEGFETDGHNANPTRYTASSSGGFSALSAHFKRTEVNGINNISGDYAGFSGSWFWAAENTDDAGGNGNKEQTLTFSDIDIAGFTNLSISGVFGAGNERSPGQGESYDFWNGAHNANSRDYIRVSYEIDNSGVETDILCFSAENHNMEANTPLGLDADCDGLADNNNGKGRLGSVLAEYSADILETGNSLTFKIRVIADKSDEEIAFDDIKVISLLSRPEPDEQISAFTATALGTGRINLSWTDAAGTNLPTGYVIYANETNSFTAPTNGTPPTIDTDLSDGNAVVTVSHAAGNRYTFTGLTALTTYYFQIWAYSNTGSDINYVATPAGLSASAVIPQVIIKEGFEDDGHGTRYTASSSGGFHADGNAYFTRTDGSNLDIPGDGYMGFDTYFWAAEDTDHANGNSEMEQTIVFNPINITGYTNLTISGLFGAGFLYLPGGGVLEKDDALRLKYQIDGGAEMTAFCFGIDNLAISRQDRSFGLDADCDGFADNNMGGTDKLGPVLSEYGVLIPETGNTLTLTVEVVANGGGDELAFDDIIVAGALRGSQSQPSNHPASFMVDASGLDGISLNWADAEGTDSPAGYVIYAGTANTLPVPVDGTPPAPDRDLFDGDAIITVNHGAGASYTFTRFTASTTYYFQIWAYSNAGDNIDYLTDPMGPTATVATAELKPVPSEQPTAFTAAASGSNQIDLSWTDATGTNLPGGYVIYAGTNSSLSAPTNGTPPTIDTDLSDGSGVVTVDHGAGSSYTFTGLPPTTTYHFQIWAYSNTANLIEYLTGPEGTTASVTTIALPEPSEQPTAFTATASGSNQIDLSWTDATGTNLPTGYVIYASETNSFNAPTDATPPIIDSNLSDGTAVVTVNHGTGGAYTYTGLTASTTYYFKIWAYSNEGSNIDYLIDPDGLTATVATTFEVVLFEEGFETDGHSSRYTASSSGGFRFDNNAHFQRTDGSDISNVSGAYTGFSGTHFWAAEDTDNTDGTGNGNEEQTITFNSINIAGFTNLSISGLFGAGNQSPPTPGGVNTTFSYDVAEYIQVSYEIDDSGTETDVLCFRYEYHGDGGNEPLGLDADCSGTADENGINRLNTTLTAYSANIPGTGAMLTIKIKVVMNSSTEEIAFDDIRVVGTSPLGTQVIPGNAGWRLLSLPKTGGTVSDIADDTAVQGITDGLNPGAAPNFVIYDHTGAWEKPGGCKHSLGRRLWLCTVFLR